MGKRAKPDQEQIDRALEVIAKKETFAVIAGRCQDVLPFFGDLSIDHVIQDPPYSEHVHGKQRRMLRGSGGRAAAGQVAGRGEVGPAALGFAALDDKTRRAAAGQVARLCRRWSLTFSDCESVHLWERDLVESGQKHVRVGAWIKIAGQPQLSGDRPAVGFEAIEIAHGTGQRCAWNNGGHPAVWHFQIATDRNATGKRLHTTQKPLDLMIALVRQFTNPGDVILDPFCGSGTTGVACLRLGRRFIGIEFDPAMADTARARLDAESRGLDLSAVRAGQSSIFDVIPKQEKAEEVEPEKVG